LDSKPAHQKRHKITYKKLPSLEAFIVYQLNYKRKIAQNKQFIIAEILKKKIFLQNDKLKRPFSSHKNP
jgi:hypothetical protein